MQVLDKMPEFKYSAYDLYQGARLLKYLRLYKRFPQLEMLMKAGLGMYYDSITILKRIGTDKQFCKWLIRNKTELTSSPLGFYIEAIMLAYKTGKPVTEINAFLKRKKCFERDVDYKPIRRLFRGQKLKEFFNYIDERKITPRLYLDYLNACQYLQLDMSEKKNSLPNDFKRWHDIRIDQYATAKAKASEEAKRNMEQAFNTVVQKYISLQHDKRSAFICILAKTPSELVREGTYLHHCVGTMNYDQKMLKEQSLIFFVRTREQPDTPFVTLEYSLRSHQVLQCYGDNNHVPDSNVLHHIKKVWLPYANKTIKQLAA